MANLFGKNKLADLAQTINTEDILPFIEIVKAWRDDPELINDKEEDREQPYNTDFFQKILGYTSKPAATYTFEAKPKTGISQTNEKMIGLFMNCMGQMMRNLELWKENK